MKPKCRQEPRDASDRRCLNQATVYALGHSLIERLVEVQIENIAAANAVHSKNVDSCVSFSLEGFRLIVHRDRLPPPPK